jgi:hypothetical protein
MAKKLTKDDADQAAKALEALFASEYVSKKHLYKANFIRGLFFSLGTIVGATITITLLLWILSLFKQIPLVGPVFDNFRHSVQQQQSK